jgi:hypothetical protein
VTRRVQPPPIQKLSAQPLKSRRKTHSHARPPRIFITAGHQAPSG